MEKNEKKHESVSIKATIEVNPSIINPSDLLPNFKEVITKRQKPNSFADVVKICGDVLFAISKK